MNFEEPTFEEYQKATAWARFRYKYSLLVLILFWLCFLFVIYYMVSNGEAIASNPLIYGADKADVTCECRNLEKDIHFIVNGSGFQSSSFVDSVVVLINRSG